MLQNHIATGGYDKIVRLFDVESGSILKTFTGALVVCVAAVRADRARRSLVEHLFGPLQPARQLDRQRVRPFPLSLHSSLLISSHSSKDASVRFWDSVSGLCIRTLNAQLGEVTSVDMKDVYLLTSSRDNAIRIWDVRMVCPSLPFIPRTSCSPRANPQLRPLHRYKAHSNTSQNFVRASFAHSSLLVSGSEDGLLYMWDRESSEVLQTLEGHEGVVRFL